MRIDELGMRPILNRFAKTALLAVLLLSPVSGLAQQEPILGTDFRLGRCGKISEFVLAVHGGAVRGRREYPRRVAVIQRILGEARAALQDGATSLDIVHASIRAMEDSGLFNAGQGARANQADVVEMDASIMDGRRLNAGAVASVKRVKNPITAARLVMQRSPQVMMVGPDADNFVARNGGDLVEARYAASLS